MNDVLTKAASKGTDDADSGAADGLFSRTGRLLRFTGSLRTRLITLMCLAMGPAAILAMLHAASSYQRQADKIQEGLFQSASLAVREEEHVIISARQMLNAIARQDAVRFARNPECGAMMAAALRDTGYYVDLVTNDAKGQVSCVSGNQRTDVDFSNRSWFRQLVAGKPYVVSGVITSLLSAQRRIVAGVPLRDDNNEIIGTLSLAIDLRALEEARKLSIVPQESIAILIDKTGEFLVPDDFPSETLAKLPAANHIATALQKTVSIFEAPGADGLDRLYVISPVFEDEIFVLYGQPAAPLLSGADANLIGSIIAPVIILVLAIITLWIGIERLVLRWVFYLRRVATAYAAGKFSVLPVQAVDAPYEFRELSETMGRMAEMVREREADLRAALNQKNMLLREVYHRVKNNLQIVMSLLNLQSRGIKDPAQVAAFTDAKNRIASLSLIHQRLYEAESLEFVHIRPFFDELCRQLMANDTSAGGRTIKLDCNVPDMTVTADVAVPLTLLVTEAVSNSLKHAFTGKSAGVINVSIEPAADAGMVLVVADDGIGMKPREERHTGVGMSLIEGFAKQLNGRVEITPGPGTRMMIYLPALKPKS